MKDLELNSRAKINLTLDIIRKRTDNYHDLKMIMQTINVCDNLSFQKNSTGNIDIKTNVASLPVDERNLVYKAIKMVKDLFNIPDGISVKLDKSIPMEAGLAGGSGNAAIALLAMNELFDLGMNTQRLIDIGKQFGADIPYCIVGKTALVEGIGDIITPLSDIPKIYLVVAKPTVNVQTKEVFQNINLSDIKERPDTEKIIKAIENKDINGIGQGLCNVMELYTAKKHPIITELKEELINYGSIGSCMTGSGSTVFGLFETKQKAEIAFENIQRKYTLGNLFLTETFN